MLASLKRLSLGLLLIAGASALLLISDLRSRAKPATGGGAPTSAPVPAPGRNVRVALLQHASQLVLDQGRSGLLAALTERGWVKDQNLTLKYYNAEGDMPVAQTIAKEMAGGGYDLLLTISTVSLQAVANANKEGKTPHVFGLVSDPYGAGIGVNRENHLDHPAHLAGYGTMQPIALAFKTARAMNPALATVGVVWNAAESNSEAQVKLARQVCAELGIKLLESTVDNSAGVAEAANALVARGVDAIWMGGDVTVMTAVDSVIAAAKKGRIPAFTVIPPNAKRGALFDLGADYYEVGHLTGLLAADILDGRKPASVPIDNVMPEILTLNRQSLAGLKDKWTISDAIAQRAQLVIDENGVEHAKTAAKTSPPALAVTTPAPKSPAAARPANPNPSGKKWKIALVVYNESPPAEETLAGMKDAWKHSPLVEGRDYEIKLRSAQGDIASVSGIIDAALTDGADIIVPLSTPPLQVAVQKVKNTPIVFSLVANPMIVGAGKSFTDHLPNVTGISVLAPVEAALDMVQKHFPGYKRLGSLYCPAEANSVDLKESLAAACKKRGLTLDVVAVNTSSELPDAALALASRPIDAILQLSDNLSSAGFSAIAKAARQAQKPLLSMNSTTVALGSAVSLGRDYHNGGEATTRLIERVIAGENPAQIPFELPPKIIYSASVANARAVGMTLPPALLKEVDKVRN
jgi:ABC-type uncharacterized transport system substrate-binding protein